MSEVRVTMSEEQQGGRLRINRVTAWRERRAGRLPSSVTPCVAFDNAFIEPDRQHPNIQARTVCVDSDGFWKYSRVDAGERGKGHIG